MTWSKLVQLAIADPEWQAYRHMMKGKETERKLELLKEYWVDSVQDNASYLRVDNYIKALCRGGQLYAGESFETVEAVNWHPRIRKG